MMADRTRLFLTAAVVAMLAAPAIGWAADEPVATAPIPPPLPSAVSSHLPLPPVAPKAHAAKAAGAPARTKTTSATPVHRTHRDLARHSVHPAKVAPHHLLANTRKPPPERRYYAGDPSPGFASDAPPPPPPWYGYYPAPWRRGPA